jgi:crossover junction endodeoxyribonuclease RusA
MHGDVILDVELPYPPSVNHYWRYARGRFYISSAGHNYRKAVIAALYGCEKLTGPVALEIEVYPPDRRRRDLDNILKSVLDALEYAGAFDDDAQVASIFVVRKEIVKGGLCRIRLRRIDSESVLQCK